MTVTPRSVQTVIAEWDAVSARFLGLVYVLPDVCRTIVWSEAIRGGGAPARLHLWENPENVVDIPPARVRRRWPDPRLPDAATRCGPCSAGSESHS